jgi:hypothetical protein
MITTCPRNHSLAFHVISQGGHHKTSVATVHEHIASLKPTVVTQLIIPEIERTTGGPTNNFL